MPDNAPQRYTTRTLPSYRHVPGSTPHPTRDPDGHSYVRASEVSGTSGVSGGPGESGGPLPDLNTSDWRHCEAYLFGIDLFNLGYWWEAHEVLEGLWLAAGTRSQAGHVLQALILCAAAHLKAESDSADSAARLFDHSLAHFKWTGPRYLGLDLEAVVRDTRTFITVGTTAPARLVLEF
jgi:hypothetical protein